MQSPFDSKNRLAAGLDRLALSALLFILSSGYFFFLWRRLMPSLLAGGALFALLLLSLFFIERRTLSHRELFLRQRLGGTIFLEELLLLPASKAQEAVVQLFCQALDAQALGGGQMRYEGETWLVRCTQCMSGSNASAGDVLAAHRAREESGARRCVLTCTTGFTAEAIRTAEWMNPPIRLIPGRQLASISGRLCPATDEAIAERARRHKTPFTRARIRALAFSPQKTRRYLLCAFLLLMLYLFSGSAAALVFMLVSFLLAIFCHQENRRKFRL